MIDSDLFALVLECQNIRPIPCPLFAIFSKLLKIVQYAIPKINMLCNLMLFENEVKAAMR